MDIKITDKDLNVDKSIAWVSEGNSGCVNVFVGRVRPYANKREVKCLKFEVYDKMAVKELEKIALSAKDRWKVDKILIHHREGQVMAGEIPVIIAVSAKHRREAIESCHYIIDTLKSTVPIWKKEVFDNGEEWVSAHP